jgi:hypothetical protein
MAPAAQAGITFGTTRTVPAATRLVGVACQSASSCLGVGDGPGGGVSVPIAPDGDGPSEIDAGVQFDGVTCPGANHCLVSAGAQNGSSMEIVPFGPDESTRGTPQMVPDDMQVNAIACPNAGTTCLAVGYTNPSTLPVHGAVLRINSLDGSAQGTPQAISGTFELHGIACPTTSSCVAVGDNQDASAGVALTISSYGTPGTVHDAAGTATLQGVACPTASSCVAIDTANGQVVPVAASGVPGRPRAINATPFAVGCPNITICLAVGGGEVVPVTAGGVPGTPRRVPDGLTAIACPSAGACVAVGGTGGNTLQGEVVPISVTSSLSLSALGASPHRASNRGRRVHGRCVRPTRKNRLHKRCSRKLTIKISYTLNEAATISVKLTRNITGRKVKGRCVEQTRKNRKHKHCKRILSAGTSSTTGKAGSNTLKLGPRKFTPGSYTVTITANANGKTSSPRSTTFTITR